MIVRVGVFFCMYKVLNYMYDINFYYLVCCFLNVKVFFEKIRLLRINGRLCVNFV